MKELLRYITISKSFVQHFLDTNRVLDFKEFAQATLKVLDEIETLAKACEGKSQADTEATAILPHVIKSVCPRCGEDKNFRSNGKKI